MCMELGWSIREWFVECDNYMRVRRTGLSTASVTNFATDFGIPPLISMPQFPSIVRAMVWHPD